MSEQEQRSNTELQQRGLFSAWKIRLNTVFWVVLILGFLLSFPVINDWATWVFLVLLAVAAILAFPTAWFRKLIFRRDKERAFSVRWTGSVLGWFFLLCMVTAAPIYYFATIAELRPMLVPQAVLSDGQKTVVFQGMMHIGSENFYKSVIYDIEHALSEGYVIYYEEVQTTSPESKVYFEKFTKALTGGEDLSGLYKILSEASGLKFQKDYFTLLEADKKEHPERHVIADVDALELKAEYERLMQTDPAFAKAHANDFKEEAEGKVSSEDLTGFVEWLRSGSESQRKLAGIVARGIITLQMSQKAEGNKKKEEGMKGFTPVVLDFRNRALVKRILEESNDKIFITYGSEHLSGVLELLQKQNPAWKVESVKWLRTIEPSKQYEREFLPDKT